MGSTLGLYWIRGCEGPQPSKVGNGKEALITESEGRPVSRRRAGRCRLCLLQQGTGPRLGLYWFRGCEGPQPSKVGKDHWSFDQDQENDVRSSGWQPVRHISRHMRCEGVVGSVKLEGERGGVQSLARQKEFGFQCRGPIGCDEIEITILVGTVDFVADDGVSDMRKVDSDLVGPAAPGFRNDESKRVTIPQPAAQDTKFGEGRVAIGMNGLFKPDFRWAHSSLA